MINIVNRQLGQAYLMDINNTATSVVQHGGHTKKLIIIIIDNRV